MSLFARGVLNEKTDILVRNGQNGKNLNLLILLDEKVPGVCVNHYCLIKTGENC